VVERLIQIWPESVLVACDYITPPPRCFTLIYDDEESGVSMEVEEQEDEDDMSRNDQDSHEEDEEDGSSHDISVEDQEDDDDDYGTLDNDCQVKTNMVSNSNSGAWHRLALDVVCDKSTSLEPLTMEFALLLTNGTSPLHFACSQPPCTSWFPYRKHTLEKLAALSVPEDWQQLHQGMLPLHCACRSKAQEYIVLWVSAKYPEALRTCTTDTMDSPLHCYLSSSTTTTISTTTTVPQKTTSAMAHDYVANQSSPLPMYSFSTVQYLVKQNPAALHSENRSGWLPIHLAAVNNVPIDILFYLARHCPESLLRVTL